jgi:hypothetical protein
MENDRCFLPGYFWRSLQTDELAAEALMKVLGVQTCTPLTNQAMVVGCGTLPATRVSRREAASNHTHLTSLHTDATLEAAQ